MAENLKVTKYNDGSLISNITNNTEWGNLLIGAYIIMKMIKVIDNIWTIVIPGMYK